MMRRLPVFVALVVVAVPGVLTAQSDRQPKRVGADQAAAVWSQALDPGVFGRSGRDADSDSDSDSDDRFDLDSDSDSERRGGILGRTRDRRARTAAECRDLEREVDRAHDEWHRRNDRYRGDRRYEEGHERLHDRMDRERERAGCARGLGGTLEDIIFGPNRDRDRRDRRSRNGDILDRLPLPGQGHPRTQERVRVEDLGRTLEDLLRDG